jgi:hypothetical protein
MCAIKMSNGFIVAIERRAGDNLVAKDQTLVKYCTLLVPFYSSRMEFIFLISICIASFDQSGWKTEMLVPSVS